MATLATLTQLLDRLDAAEIDYTLSSVNEDAIMVVATLPEERWEIEFSGDGNVEIEIFESDGEIHGESMLEELFQRHAAADEDDD